MTDSINYVWRLTPVARPGDPAWQGRQIWSEFTTVAASAGQAIFYATEYDKRQRLGSDAASQDHQQSRSGFEDERLYRVDRTDVPVPTDAASGDVLQAYLLE